jgi:hypothetical protein
VKRGLLMVGSLDPGIPGPVPAADNDPMSSAGPAELRAADRPVGAGWRVRLCGPGGRPLGAGVLVDSDLVLTSARVRAGVQASGVSADPIVVVTVSFPAGREGRTRPGHVYGADWLPAATAGAARLTLLRLAGRAGVEPARLALCGEPDDRPVLVYGHPPQLGGGVWARVRLGSAGGSSRELVRLTPDTSPGPCLGAGFGGAGVLDVRVGAVVGIVVEEADFQPPRAWMVSLDAAAAGFPALAGLITLPDPLPLRRGWLFELLDTVLAVPAMADERSRELIVRQLRADIASTVQRNTVARFDVWAILRTCLNYPGGLAELVEVLRVFEGDSVPMQRLAHDIAQLPADTLP